MRMVTVNHIRTNLLEVMLLHSSRNWVSAPICTAEDVDETVDCDI